MGLSCILSDQGIMLAFIVTNETKTARVGKRDPSLT